MAFYENFTMNYCKAEVQLGWSQYFSMQTKKLKCERQNVLKDFKDYKL